MRTKLRPAPARVDRAVSAITSTRVRMVFTRHAGSSAAPTRQGQKLMGQGSAVAQSQDRSTVTPGQTTPTTPA